MFGRRGDRFAGRTQGHFDSMRLAVGRLFAAERTLHVVAVLKLPFDDHVIVAGCTCEFHLFSLLFLANMFECDADFLRPMPIVNALERRTPKPVVVLVGQFGFNREMPLLRAAKDGRWTFAIHILVLEAANRLDARLDVAPVRLRDNDEVKPKFISRQVIHFTDTFDFAICCQNGVCDSG